MVKMIKDAIILQKRELESRLSQSYIRRLAPTKNFSNDMIKVIIGPRRAGKSFFAAHFLRNQGKFGYINFDDEKLTDTKDYDEIITAMNSVYDNPQCILFDEIQNLPKWELFVNRLQRQGLNLVITGSNSHLLSKELATHLTGRHLSLLIFPFSFKEYLELDAKELTTSEIKERLNRYIIYGGYPEPAVKNIDYADYLSTLFDAIIYKDIVKRHDIRHPKEIEEIAFYLLSNIAAEYSSNSLTNVISIKSSHTTQKYVFYLEESFIFFSITRFSYKLKEQLSSNRKVYCIDNGFIYAKAFKTSPNIGKLYENAVAIELKRGESLNKSKIYYWKSLQQEEVDFIVKEGTKIRQLIQVCYDLKNNETKNREIRSLLKAQVELKCNNLLVITSDYENEEKAEWFGIKGKIKFIPLWKWLLDNRQI